MSKKSKIRESARGEECTLRIPGVCCGDPETVVFAHAPCEDNGMGLKASPDYMCWGAYACHRCHDFLDGRAISSWWDSSDPDVLWLRKLEFWWGGVYRTQKILREKGLK